MSLYLDNLIQSLNVKLALKYPTITQTIDDNVSDDIKGNFKKRQTSFIYEDHYVEKDMPEFFFKYEKYQLSFFREIPP